MSLFFQLQINGLVIASMYALIALSFGMVYRTTGIFHIALGGLYTLSAYIAYTLLNIKLGFIFALIGAIILTIIFSIIIEIFVYKPLYKKKSGSGVILIASLGLYIILENSIAMIYGNEIKLLSDKIEPSVSFANILLTRIQIVQFFIGIILIIVFFILIKKFRIFKAIWAMGEESDLIRSMGIPIFNLRLIVFSISAIFIAFASVFTAYDIGIDPHIGMSAFLIGAVAVLVGGKDNPLGWVLSAFIISFFQSLVIWQFSAKWNDAITYTILIIVLLLRPNGLFSRSKRKT